MQMDANKCSTLSAELQAFGLSADTVSDICVLCAELRRFEFEEKPAMKTNAQRAKKLLSMAVRLRELRTEVDTLSNGDWMTFDDALLFLGSPRATENPEATPTDSNVNIGACILYMQRNLCLFAAAAGAASRMVAGETPMNELGGRKATLGAYAGHIARLAVILKEKGIRPGRGGDFEKISDLIFQSAGVHSKAEGAIRYYMKNMYSDYKSKGFAI